MKTVAVLVAGLYFSAFALADKYGIDEAMSENTGSISDMVWGGVLIGGIYWLWKKFF